MHRRPFVKLRRGLAMRSYPETPGLNLRLVNPRFHEGRPCRVTARTSTPMRRDGQGRRRRETSAWGPKPWCSRGPTIPPPGWPAGKMRSNGVAGPSCKQGLKHSCGTSGTQQMHIPSWPWFRVARRSPAEVAVNCIALNSTCRPAHLAWDQRFRVSIADGQAHPSGLERGVSFSSRHCSPGSGS